MWNLQRVVILTSFVILVTKASGDVGPYEAVVNSNSQQLSLLTARLTALENRLKAAETTVAFHAYHSTDPFNVASQGTIVYDSVTTNIGNAYDSKTGFFSAPVSGTYLFFINCMSRRDSMEELSIMLNNKVLASFFSNTSEDSSGEQGATLTTVHVTQGERVSVRLLQNAEQVRGRFWKTFAGVLIQADVQ